MRKSVLAEVLQTPKWEKALLQKFCKRQNGKKRFCRNAAKPRNFFEVFAGVPQVSQETFWSLRESRKCPEKLFGVCRTSARTLFLILVFAELLQERFSPFWRLQNFCKSAFSHFGLCRDPASLPENFLAFAGVPQVPRKTFWRLRDSRKHLQSRGPSGRRTEMRFRAFHTEIKRLYLCQRF